MIRNKCKFSSEKRISPCIFRENPVYYREIIRFERHDFMRKHKLPKIFCTVLAVTLAVGVIASVGSTVAAVYDSAEDPVISLSYLYDVFKVELLDEVKALIGNSSDERTVTVTRPEASSGATYEVVELTRGDCLYAEGACDLMLRSGTAVCIAPDVSQGIADYTSAYEIYNGDSLTKNHMCLIPRGDGRGVCATSDSVYIMVRGEYSIVKGY